MAGKSIKGSGRKRKIEKAPEKKATQIRLAAGSFVPVDISAVSQKSDILKNAKIEVLSYGSGRKSKDSVAKLITEMGGQVNFVLGCRPCHCIPTAISSVYRLQLYMNMTPSVTHYLTEKADHWQVGIRIKRNYDVLTLDWLLDVHDAGRLIQPQPHHYIFMSNESRDHKPFVDCFGDL